MTNDDWEKVKRFEEKYEMPPKNNQTDKLKPCPFCKKSVAEHTTVQNCELCANFENEEMCPNYEECGYGHFIVCNANKGGCGASTGWYQTVEEAMTAWNRRTP